MNILYDKKKTTTTGGIQAFQGKKKKTLQTLRFQMLIILRLFSPQLSSKALHKRSQ